MSTFGFEPSICTTWLNTSNPGRKTVRRNSPGNVDTLLKRNVPLPSVDVRCVAETGAVTWRTEVNAASLVG